MFDKIFKVRSKKRQQIYVFAKNFAYKTIFSAQKNRGISVLAAVSLCYNVFSSSFKNSSHCFSSVSFFLAILYYMDKGNFNLFFVKYK